ncbi:hypothetical protein GN956_G15591 [Arapaima gigas]
MLSWALLYMLAVFCSARRSHTFPLYSDSSLVPTAELIQKLITDEEKSHFGDLQRVKDLYPLLPQQNAAGDMLTKGDFLSSALLVVEDLKAAVLKLAAVDSLQSHGFLQADQHTPKTSKRACFWKYCVTN